MHYFKPLKISKNIMSIFINYKQKSNGKQKIDKINYREQN